MHTRRAIALRLFVASGAATVNAQLRLRTHSAGFTFPLAIVQDPADRALSFVVQQNGIIKAVRAGAVDAGNFLDVSTAIISGGEQGLLGMAFSPDTATNGRFFVNFTNRSGDTVVARFRRATPTAADSTSRFDLR